MMVAPTLLSPDALSAAEDAPAYRATDLLAGGTTARIVLDDRVYTLRLTRAGKLILTR